MHDCIATPVFVHGEIFCEESYQCITFSSLVSLHVDVGGAGVIKAICIGACSLVLLQLVGVVHVGVVLIGVYRNRPSRLVSLLLFLFGMDLLCFNYFYVIMLLTFDYASK